GGAAVFEARREAFDAKDQFVQFVRDGNLVSMLTLDFCSSTILETRKPDSGFEMIVGTDVRRHLFETVDGTLTPPFEADSVTPEGSAVHQLYLGIDRRLATVCSAKDLL